MPDCSNCEHFEANDRGKVVPCPQSGRRVIVPSASAGEKQHTLLYLVYVMAADMEHRNQPRSTSFGLTGQKLVRRRTTPQKQLEQETQRLVGMVLAQRVRTLSTWALQRWEPQEALIASLTEAIFTDPGTLFDPQEVPFGSFTGRGGNSEATLRARGYARKVHERIASLQAQLHNPDELLRQASAEVDEQIKALFDQASRAQQAKSEKVDLFPRYRKNQVFVLTGQQTQVVSLGSQYVQRGQEIDSRLLHLKGLWEGTTDATLREQYDQEANALLVERKNIEAMCVELSTKVGAYSDEIQAWNEMTPDEYARDLSDEIARLEQSARQIDGSRVAMAEQRAAQIQRELQELGLLAQIWRAKAEESAQQDYARARQQRDVLLRESLVNDFALQKENYHARDHNWVNLLNAAVDSDLRAAHIFLSLHPKFKYTWTAPIMCRTVKLMTDATPNGFLDTWQQLDQAGLSSPGNHARLGVFVLNSLKPGGYDEDHRQMVQWELDYMVQAMREFGVGDRITCHSCGAVEFRDPNKSGWIRDHNPPTAMVDLFRNQGIDLGLRFYDKSPLNTARQILLPQCLGCSERQSSIAARAKDLLSGQAWLVGQPAAVVRAHLAGQLTAEERADLCRLVLNPGVGWSTQGQSNDASQVAYDGSGYAQIAFDPNLLLFPTELVTSGVPGSFAGIDDDLLARMGDQYGCHTCVDVANQTDAYRGISWIADHQPPTALVERGLAELPQLVLPHCHACSKKQSKLTRRLARLFDDCFGSGWGAAWSEDIAVSKFDDS